MLLTVSEVAIKLRVDGTTVRRWIKQGLLKAHALPTKSNRQKYRIPEQEVYDILKSEK